MAPADVNPVDRAGRQAVLDALVHLEIVGEHVGLEDQPERCGEICVVEVFGDAVTGAGAAVGMGVKALHDPSLRQDFAAPVLPIDVDDSGKIVGLF